MPVLSTILLLKVTQLCKTLPPAGVRVCTLLRCHNSSSFFRLCDKLGGPEKVVVLAQQNSYWSSITQFNSNSLYFLFLFLMAPELKGFTSVLEDFVFPDLSHLIPFRFLFYFPSQCYNEFQLCSSQRVYSRRVSSEENPFSNLSQRQ